jgi:Ca2+-binding RTX toxin-like protein
MQRTQQATIVADFVQARLALDANARIIVAGDLNDFEFANPVSVLEGVGLSTLIEVLPAQERYTYNFQGNAQTLDHILTSASLRSALDGFDVVHMNSEFADQISDHDPSVARFNIERAGVVRTGDAGANTLVGTEFADTLIGGLGRDVLTGGLGRDRFVYTSLLDAGDRITDFVVGTDRLVVDQMLARLGYTGSDPIGDGYLNVFDSGADILVTIDPDGSAGPAAARLLAELTGIPSSNAQELFF